jgi:hypothetical protein
MLYLRARSFDRQLQLLVKLRVKDVLSVLYKLNQDHYPLKCQLGLCKLKI